MNKRDFKKSWPALEQIYLETYSHIFRQFASNLQRWDSEAARTDDCATVQCTYTVMPFAKSHRFKLHVSTCNCLSNDVESEWHAV